MWLHVAHTFDCEIALLEVSDLLREVKVQSKTIKRSSLVVGAIGLALLVLMVTTEGEPGALPLGLLLIAVVGYIGARIKERPAKGIDPAA